MTQYSIYFGPINWCIQIIFMIDPWLTVIIGKTNSAVSMENEIQSITQYWMRQIMFSLIGSYIKCTTFRLVFHIFYEIQSMNGIQFHSIPFNSTKFHSFWLFIHSHALKALQHHLAWKINTIHLNFRSILRSKARFRNLIFPLQNARFHYNLSIDFASLPEFISPFVNILPKEVTKQKKKQKQQHSNTQIHDNSSSPLS